MATVIVTTGNWNDPSFWSGVNVSAGDTLDMSALGTAYGLTLDEATNGFVIDNGGTLFSVGGASTTGADATLATGEVTDFSTFIAPDGTNDTTLTDGAKTYTGGDGVDSVTGSWAADTIGGGAGNDLLRGGGGDDSIVGGSGNDTLVGDSSGQVDLSIGGSSRNGVNPEFEVYADGVLVHTGEVTWAQDGTTAFDPNAPGAFESVTIALPNGMPASVEVRFINDYVAGDEVTPGDRNLHLDSITVGSTTYEAENDATISGGFAGAQDANLWGTGSSATFDTSGAAPLGGSDTLEGGADADTFLVHDGFGNDTIIGGEGGADNDVIDLSTLTSPVTVTYTDTEEGTITDGTDTIDFSEIEKIVLGDSADSVDATATTGAVEIDGGAGNDTIFYGDGDNTVTGGAGDDYIDDSLGNPGWTGANSIDAGDGNDTVWSGYGNDTISGGDGDDRINAQWGDDSVEGGAGDDEISSEWGASTLSGGTGNDTLIGGYGNDSLLGGDDADTFNLAASFGADTIIGGEGGTDDDVIDLSALTGAVTVTYTDAEDGTITDGSNTITFSEIERLILGDGADVVYGTADTLGISVDAGGGNDSIDGSNLGDTLVGGTGNDTINGGNDNDTLIGGGGDDSLLGEIGNDSLEGGVGSDTLDGGDGNDTLLGGDGADQLSDGEGDDSVSAGDGDDTIGGWTGNDTLQGGAGHDKIEGGDGADSIQGGSGDDFLVGYDAAGLTSGSTAVATDDGSADTISGGSGADTISGGRGADSLSGGDDADSFVVQDNFGNDTIAGGEGGTDSDTLNLSDLNSSVTLTFSGNEQGTVSDGSDTLSFTEIERFVATDQSDNVDARTTSQGIHIQAGDGADTILGGSGHDEIYGQSGNDSVDAGDGKDTISGGAGDDSVTGGGGDDTFSYAAGDGADTITDFNFGNSGALNDGDTTNNDFIDLSGFYDNVFDLRADFDDDGILNQSNSTANGGIVDYTGGSQFASGEGITFQGLSGSTALTTDNTGTVCFAGGTLISTPAGDVPIEHLTSGDMVLTRDNGPQPLVWIACKVLTAQDFRTNPNLLPVVIAPDVSGGHAPLWVSPQHGMLLRVDGEEKLIRANHLARMRGGHARIANGCQRVTYYHLLFEDHQIVFANGANTESFFPGQEAIKALSAQARSELFTLFPDLKAAPTQPVFGTTARSVSRWKSLPENLSALQPV